jgi:hypothetical protein
VKRGPSAPTTFQSKDKLSIPLGKVYMVMFKSKTYIFYAANDGDVKKEVLTVLHEQERHRTSG